MTGVKFKLSGKSETMRHIYQAGFLPQEKKKGEEIWLQVCINVSLENWNVPKTLLSEKLNASYQQAKTSLKFIPKRASFK